MSESEFERIVIRPTSRNTRADTEPGDASEALLGADVGGAAGAQAARELDLDLEVFDDAELRELRGRVAERPNDAAGYEALGRALAERGLPLAALPLFDHAAELDPESARAQYNLGVAHLMVLRADAETKADWAEDHLGAQEHYFAAQQAFETALRLDPSLAEARTNLNLLGQLDLSSL